MQSIAFFSQIPAPILIKLFIEWLGSAEEDMRRGYILASILVFINFINPTFELISDHYMSLAVLRQSIMAKVSKPYCSYT